MKKKYLIISISILLVLSICLYVFKSNNEEKVVLQNENGTSHIINTNALTMMYETEAGSGEYVVSSDTSWPQEGYTFNETLSKCENGSTLTWSEENKRVIMSTSVSDKCYVYFDKEPDIIYLADYIMTEVYTGTDGDNDLYYHDGVGSYVNADQEAGDNSYRYAGANPNNYVCFGSNEKKCSEENLYRIIGVFNDQVKLIKNTSIGNNLWDSDSIVDITWINSAVKNILNNSFLSSINSTWQNKIASQYWNDVSVVSSSNFNIIPSVKEFYNRENMESATFDFSKVGLMYASDYGYGASSEAWLTNLDSYNDSSIISNNWLYTGADEWTIDYYYFQITGSITITQKGAVNISSTGSVSYNDRYNIYAIRPCFYLNSDVLYISGTGTQEDPYRIA